MICFKVTGVIVAVACFIGWSICPCNSFYLQSCLLIVVISENYGTAYTGKAICNYTAATGYS